MNIPKQNRVYWIDYAKGIGIFLVVIGHICRGLMDSSILSPSIARLIDQWIYAFHMPIFFFLSGLLIQCSVAKSLKNFVVDKLKNIAYPYFLWSIIQGMLVSAAFKYTNNSIPLTDIWRIIYQPIFIFWFLYVLFIIIILYKLAHDLKASPVHFLIFSIFLYCLHLLQSGFISWSVLDLVCRFTIYFAIGATVSSQLIPWLSQINITLLISVTIGGFLTVAVTVLLGIAENQLLIPFIAMIGVSATISLAILLEQSKLANFVKVWGLFSLQIYVVHTIVTSGTRIVLQKIFGFTEPSAHIFLGTIAGIYVPIGSVGSANKLNFDTCLRFIPRALPNQETNHS
jgi:fucose 4-O-acetylase-like acetyltransferase